LCCLPESEKGGDYSKKARQNNPLLGFFLESHQHAAKNRHEGHYFTAQAEVPHYNTGGAT
jgi:hypothetical protein